MKTKEEIKEIEQNIKIYLTEGLLQKGDYKHLTEFYLKTAKKTLATADALMQLSDKKELKGRFNLFDDFETYLWVITTSYYSMFYAVNALFSDRGLKTSDKIVHKVAFDAFYYYFIKNNKIAKEMYDIYEEAKEQALDLTNTKYPEEAERLSEYLNYELNKRHKFQYNMTESIKRGFAQTSLNRAKEFINKISVLIA